MLIHLSVPGILTVQDLTDVPATLCNGRRSCRIRQQILIYPQGSVGALCQYYRDANFLRITFTCITGICIVSLLHVSYVIISCIIIKCENCFLSSAPHLCRGKTGILIILVSISLHPSVCVCPSHFLSTRLQVRPLNGFCSYS